MKRILLSLGLLLSITGAAQAQSTRLGLKAGLSLSDATGSGSAETSNLLGFNGGMMLDAGISDLLSFHPELLFSQRGVEVNSKDPYGSGGTATGQARLNYVDLPLLLRIKSKGLFFEVGPQIGILVSRKTEITYSYPNQGSHTTTATSTSGVRKVDVGYVLGLGYQLPQGLELGVRYNGGLLDLSDPSGSSKNYNSVFQFQVGYLFAGQY